jgi:hypothetical protein
LRENTGEGVKIKERFEELSESLRQAKAVRQGEDALDVEIVDYH